HLEPPLRALPRSQRHRASPHKGPVGEDQRLRARRVLPGEDTRHLSTTASRRSRPTSMPGSFADIDGEHVELHGLSPLAWPGQCGRGAGGVHLITSARISDTETWAADPPK